MNKHILLASIFFIMINFTACGDKKDSEQKNEVQANTVSAGSPKIEVVANKNEYAIKVKSSEDEIAKGKSGNKNSFYYDYGEKSEYDQNAQPANKDASVRVRPRTVLDAQMHIRSPYERVQISLIAKQLSPTFRLKCSACHDDYANGVLGPSLLGRNADYIYDKIIAFKTGKKKNVFMNDLIHNMSDAEIRAIAEDIYNFNVQIQKIRNK
ncbi:c-type cytochrome [Sulfurimonas sp. NWX367]|uniref:c-type cytochrome n=1 Tax=unclassified Sulfurimonas TaxID=2623549 RepID=UPI003204A33B